MPKVEGFSDLELIAKGGQSVVYKARQESFDRTVAIKVMDIEDDIGARRFAAEQRAMGRLSGHPGVVTAYSTMTTSDGRPALVMTHVDNGSMASLLVDGGMHWRTAVELVLEVARTVAAAHEVGVIHRDLKPANLLLDRDGRPKVADFGIAKAANDESQPESTSLTFTPMYSPPEAFSSSNATKAVDVYGLGATLWALLAGHPPFKTPDEPVDLLKLINRVLNEPLGEPRPGLPAGLTSVLRTSLAKDSTLRFPDAGALAVALVGVLQEPDAVPAPTIGAADPQAAVPPAAIVRDGDEPSDEPSDVTVCGFEGGMGRVLPGDAKPAAINWRSLRPLLATLARLLATVGGIALVLPRARSGLKKPTVPLSPATTVRSVRTRRAPVVGMLSR